MAAEALSSFSQDNYQNLGFDLSLLSPGDFSNVVKGIETYAKSQISSLTFSLDLFHEYCPDAYPVHKPSQPCPRSDACLPIELTQSAYFTDHGTVQTLLDLLSRVLPESIALFTVGFRHFLFGESSLQFPSVFSQWHSIRDLSFSGCDLGDLGFAALCDSLKHPGLISLTCESCGLTNASVEPLVSLLQFNSILRGGGRYGSASLSKLNLRDNLFTSLLLMECRDHLVNLTLLDIRNNGRMAQTVVTAARRSNPRLHIRSTTPDPKRHVNDDEIVLDRDVRIGGPGAQQFVDVLFRVCDAGSRLEQRERAKRKKRKSVAVLRNVRLCPFEAW
jgi:hypothetical protein